MSNITNAFKSGKAFIGFLTAGDPNISCCEKNILALIEGGAALVEIGIPFSDPIADGETIQRANIRALKNKVGFNEIFELVKRVRAKTSVPIVFLTYLNPVFRFGYEKFFFECKRVGVDGIIVPDCPYEERGEIKEFAEINGVDIITLIAPTSLSRVKMLAESAEGFIYLVSSMGVTGERKDISTDLSEIIKNIREVTKVPICIGFGISTPLQAKQISRIADGVIVGSAIVKIIEQQKENAQGKLKDYVESMVKAMK